MSGRGKPTGLHRPRPGGLHLGTMPSMGARDGTTIGQVPPERQRKCFGPEGRSKVTREIRESRLTTVASLLY